MAPRPLPRPRPRPPLPFRLPLPAPSPLPLTLPPRGNPAGPPCWYPCGGPPYACAGTGYPCPPCPYTALGCIACAFIIWACMADVCACWTYGPGVPYPPTAEPVSWTYGAEYACIAFAVDGPGIVVRCVSNLAISFELYAAKGSKNNTVYLWTTVQRLRHRI